MAKWEEIRHQVAISGKVTDSATGKGLKQVRIEIVDAPPVFLDMITIQKAIQVEKWETLRSRPDRVFTAPDGHFHFMDLPDGEYTLEAVFPEAMRRYGSVRQTVTVSRTPGGNIHMAVADMVLPSSAIHGKVVRQGTTTPVGLAEVRVIGSGEVTHTNNAGEYCLSGLETSATSHRPLSISATGYQDKTANVLLAAPGDEVTLDIELTPV